MSSEIILRQDRIIQCTLSEFLTPEKMSEIATNIGYNIKGDFLPNEFAHFVDATVIAALEEVKTNLKNQGAYSESQENRLKGRVSSIVNQELKKVCHVSQDKSLPELDLPLSWRKWLTSFLHMPKD